MYIYFFSRLTVSSMRTWARSKFFTHLSSVLAKPYVINICYMDVSVIISNYLLANAFLPPLFNSKI